MDSTFTTYSPSDAPVVRTSRRDGLLRRVSRTVGARNVIACLTLTCVALLGSPVFGDSGNEMRLPTVASKTPSGWNLVLDTRWVEGAGYRPVRVKLSTLGNVPTTSQRTVTVMISTRDNWGRGERTVMQDLDVEQGASGTSAVMLLPETNETSWLELNCFEDGEPLRDISERVGIATSGQRTEAAPNLMFVSAGLVEPVSGVPAPPEGTLAWLPDLAPCITQFESMGTNQNQIPTWSPSQADRAVNQVNLEAYLARSARHIVRTPEDLPDDWLGLTSLDIIFTTRVDLEWLAKNRPRKLAALRAWVATGTVLCVCDAGMNYEHLKALEQTLDLAPSRGRPTADGKSAWRLPDPQRYDLRPDQLLANGSTVQYVQTPQGIQTVVQSPYSSNAPGETAKPTPTRQPPDPEWFAMRPLGLGRVVAFREREPFPGSHKDWDWLIQSFGSGQFRWFQRHGMSRWRDNPDFTNFPVKGVGQAPVVAFLVLITVFAVVIGPANYFWLRRQRRLYLLPATVLLGAGGVTSALLIYAMLADGFQVRARVRSITAVDPVNGTSVSWSRQTYYAGLAPSGGMTFARDTAVYPIIPDSDNSQSTSTRWDDQQRLASGFLPSRSMTQFLVIRSGDSQLTLDVERQSGDGDPHQVVNRLGTRIEFVVVRDEEGAFHEASDVAPGASGTLKPSDLIRAQSQFLAANPALVSQWTMSGWGYRRWYNMDMNLPSPQMLSSRMEQAINGCGVELEKMPRGSFAALVADPVDAPLGVDGTKVQRDVHVVIGPWREAQ